VGWYHSHPGFGCWLSGVDVNTQQSFEALNQRAVAGEHSRWFGCAAACWLAMRGRVSRRVEPAGHGGGTPPRAPQAPEPRRRRPRGAAPAFAARPSPRPSLWAAVVVDPIQSVKGKVVIDAFRCIRCFLVWDGQQARVGL